MKTFSRALSLVLSLTALVSTVGCAPRGESHTVDEILNDARSSYSEISSSVSGDISGTLKTLSGSLDKLAGLGGGGDARQVAAGIVDTLTNLGPKAGFTQRAAIAELTNQYRTVATAQGAPVALGAPNLKLVVARTYSLLSAELTSTKFRL
jgi:hypothetical protein